MTDKTVELADVMTAIEAAETKSAEALEAKGNDIKAVREEANTAIAEVKTLLEELQAKGNRPGDSKAEADAETKEDFRVFAKEGIDGLRIKGANLQATVDAQGGYAVPEELSRTILTLQHETSPMRSLANVIQIGTSDYKQVVATGSAASGWVGETDARPNTNTPDLTQINAIMGEVYANPLTYQHILEDGFFDIEGWLASEVAREFNEQENVAFLTGNGTNKPVGLLNGQGGKAAGDTAGDATRAFGTIQSILSGTDASLGVDTDTIIANLKAMVRATKTGYLRGASFMMNRETQDQISELKDADGRRYLQGDLSKPMASTLFGYPIVINDDVDSAGTADNVPVIFGDISRAITVVDRVGMSTLRDPYTVKGAVNFYTRKRVGSLITNTEAVKVLVAGDAT